MSEKHCRCLSEPLSFDQYDNITFLGIDDTHGRFGEVKMLRCTTCGRYWLHYFVEYESFRGSGRYFMGLVTPETAERLSPDRAVEYLNSLDWHLYGGSYFFGKTGKATGLVCVDC